MISLWIVAFIFLNLILIASSDIRTRQVRHRDLLCLIFLILLLWYWQPNWHILPYSGLILLVGFGLHIFKLLGAGDTKLLFVISLGVAPEFLSLYIYGTVLLGGVFAMAYLYCTDMMKVRQRGVPYAVPISFMGSLMILISNVNQLNA